MSFLHGLGLGLSTAIIIGPVFFTLLKNALQYGRNAGIAVAIGIILSDILVFFICYYIALSYLESILNHQYSYWIAAALLLLFGFSFIFKKIKAVEELPKSTTKNILSSLVQGFLVNFVNPFVFLIWIAFISIGDKKYTADLNFSLFIFGILLGVFATDLLKALLAHRIRHLLKQRYLSLVYKLIGIVLLLFALRLIVVQ